MSYYQFYPKQTVSQNYPFVTWENGFSPEEVDSIKQLCLSLPRQKALLGDRPETEGFSDIRESKVSWLSFTPESAWIYERLSAIGRNLNSQFYQFDLFGFVEDMQFAEYDSVDNGHYTWHLDMSDTAISPRKLSMVLQLSDPEEYEGGELQTQNAAFVSTVPKQKGLVTAFPSWALHRVTPVTKGIRHSLVVWICGPSFK